MKLIRSLLLISALVLAFSWIGFSGSGIRNKVLSASNLSTSRNEIFEKVREKAITARAFVHSKGFNENYCFLVDMSLPSGKNRFFIYNFEKDSIEVSGLVAHGNCFEYWLAERKFSNVVGSGCTSLGKYKIGIPYTGKFGYSYKLHGLDSSNNNAFERTVVLHGHSCIPETEVSDEICQSNGCPTVAPQFLSRLKTIISGSRKPLLLWIYE
jgi:hypothetical protein